MAKPGRRRPNLSRRAKPELERDVPAGGLHQRLSEVGDGHTLRVAKHRPGRNDRGLKRSAHATSKVAPRSESAQQDEQVQAWPELENNIMAAIASSFDGPEAWLKSGQSLRDAIDQGVREGLGLALQASADRWTAEVLGAGRYERTSARSGHRGGIRTHGVHFAFGPVTLQIEKPRRGQSRPDWLAALKKRPAAMMELARNLWIRGLSTRDLAATSDLLANGQRSSHTTIAGWVRDVADDVLKWQNRPLRADIRYLVLGALYVPVIREGASKEPILVALGITENGEKEILDVLPAVSESTDSWSALLSRLKARRLRSGTSPW